MVVVQLVSQLAGVGQHAIADVDIPERSLRRGASQAGRNSRTDSAIGRIAELGIPVMIGVPRRVERTEEEQLLPESGDLSADLNIRVIVGLVLDLALQIETLIRRAIGEVI